MRKIFKRLHVVALCAVVLGCAGGKKVEPVEEKIPMEDSLASHVFLFAESSGIRVDSDMMGAQFLADHLPTGSKEIDSAKALDAVYKIFLDSVLAREAGNYDLKTSPHLYKQYMELRNQNVMRLMFQKLIVDSVTVSDSQISARYEVDREEFKLPDQYRARHIVINGSGLKASEDSSLYAALTNDQLDSIAHAKVIELRERIIGGESFDTLAMIYSHDPRTAHFGGDLGYFQLEQMVPPFDSTIENTPPGEISGVVNTEYGWHIVRVEDFSPEHYLPLDSVYDQIKNKVMGDEIQKRGRAFSDSVHKAGIIVYDTAAMMTADSLHDNMDPVAYINPDDKEFGNDTAYFNEYAKAAYHYKRALKIKEELSFDQKAEVIDRISFNFNMLRAARQLGFTEHDSITTWSKEKILQYSVSELQKKLIDDGYEPSDEELRAYYDANIEKYQIDRPVSVQHIIFSDSNLAVHVRDILMSGGDFMEMVDKYYPGDPDIRRAAADLGNIGPDDMPAPFYRTAMATQVNTISHPVKTEFGYHIIKVLGKSHSVAFENARSSIRPILIKRHKEKVRRDYVDSKLDEPIKIHWDRLGDLYFKKFEQPDFGRMLRRGR